MPAAMTIDMGGLTPVSVNHIKTEMWVMCVASTLPTLPPFYALTCMHISRFVCKRRGLGLMFTQNNEKPVESLVR